MMFFDISLFKLLPPPHTIYKHIVAVKVTIDKQSPHAKLFLKSGFFKISKWTLLVIATEPAIEPIYLFQSLSTELFPFQFLLL